MADPRYAIPGLSLSIKADCGAELNYARGTAVLGATVPLTEHTGFRVGSVTKAFTGYLTMRLVQAGRFTLDSTLGELLPEVGAALPLLDVGHITVRHLLNHTSGISTYASLGQGIYAQVLAAPTAVWTNEAVLAALRDARPVSAPGQRFGYSNSNYYLLGMIAERATGLAYEDALRQLVIEPLGLKETLAPSPGHPEMPEGAAHGYMALSADDASLRDFTAVDPSYPWAAGAVVSTTSDLATFARALHERRLLQGEYRDEAFFPIPEAPGYAYGAGITRNDENDSIGHDGNIFGYECSTLYLLRVQVAVAACINRSLFDPGLPGGSSLKTVLMDKVTAVLNLPEIADERVEALRRAGGIDGVQVAVRSHGGSVVRKYGASRPDRPWAEGDLHRIASVSKSFIAALVMDVVRSGELAVTSPVDAFIAAGVLPRIDLGAVTIGDLLRHSSGIPDYFTSDFLQTIIDHPDVEKTEADALRAVQDLPGEFAPGAAIKYSNTNYLVLGMILDGVAKRHGRAGHAELLRELVLDPLGLHSTFYERKEASRFDASAIVSGFLDGEDYRGVEQGYGLANGGLVSTVADVARFYEGIFDAAGPLPVGALMAPRDGDDYGWGLYRLRPGRRFIGHTGEFAGYLSFAAYDPATKTVAVATANNSGEAAKAQFTALQDYLLSLLEEAR
jgi:D-alanyl-D-alanine carboxypeptidase